MNFVSYQTFLAIFKFMGPQNSSHLYVFKVADHGFYIYFNLFYHKFIIFHLTINK